MGDSVRRILTVGAALAWVAALGLAGRERTQTQAHAIAPVASTALQKHYVTPGQLVECGALTDRRIESFSALAHDGARFTWPAVGEARPLVLVFIKRDCPCSVEFEPIFHRLEAQYRDVAEFVGVIDAGLDQAHAYAVANKVPYRVLADPERAIIGRFEAKHGGYVALLGMNGAIDALWPGCSAEMLRELGSRIAALGARAERPIDVRGTPKVLTTGCPYMM